MILIMTYVLHDTDILHDTDHDLYITYMILIMTYIILSKVLIEYNNLLQSIYLWTMV